MKRKYLRLGAPWLSWRVGGSSFFKEFYMPTGKMIASTTQRPLGLSLKLAEGIKPERFARLPNGSGGAVQTNHPCFVYGHLALYMPRVCELLGQPQRAQEVAVPATWNDLFGMGRPCVDDPDGSIYPAMSAVLDHFKGGYEAAIDVTAQTPDDVFTRANPNERMREALPTLGAVAIFLLTGHTMFHLGQVSAWRRIEGLASAM
jgi:hypothetical protein